MADPGEVGGSKLQTLGHQVAEVVQGVVNCPSLLDVSVDTVDIPEGSVGGTLGAEMCLNGNGSQRQWPF